MLPQVIDAKEDSGDCQREHLSRKLAALTSQVKTRKPATTLSDLCNR